MSDARLRALERACRLEPDACEGWWVERLRTGEITRKELELRAYHGDAVAGRVCRRLEPWLLLVHIWADWCRLQGGPVQTALRELEAERDDVGEVFADCDDPTEWERYAGWCLTNVPTVVACWGGVRVDMRVGSLPKGQYRAWIETLHEQLRNEPRAPSVGQGVDSLPTGT